MFLYIYTHIICMFICKNDTKMYIVPHTLRFHISLSSEGPKGPCTPSADKESQDTNSKQAF